VCLRSEADAAWPEDEYETGQLQCLQRPLGLALPPTPRRRRVAVAHGFSLHADNATGERCAGDYNVIALREQHRDWYDDDLEGPFSELDSRQAG